MSRKYKASDIEVLSGLDPVRRRPGMYTDTSRPDHLAREVIDNAVDEALAGHCKKIEVQLHKDGSMTVKDDGRGMPVDKHPEEKIPGVELILTRLHAGGKFSDKNYEYAGGLHGVGVSVVNALSSHLEVWVRRGGREYNMAFKDGDKASDLEVVDKVGKANTGTTLQFWPNAKYFDSEKFSVAKLKHLLRAKAVLCPNLLVRLTEANGKKTQWQYAGGLGDYLAESIGDVERLPDELFSGAADGERESAHWALAWSVGE
ncbi:MAG: DNA topoisomerase IV subunit B, partial [Gammaproteobacteria bacterium]|nr:DNA topoisomerase IV subunit B [Gammaproteobacteria bacterium]